MPIQILPPRLANQIAAGEVVERPASVVKELVENSLDAGATRIDVEVENGGHRLIRIRDNGCGIEKAQLALALARHATSKISHLDDLEAIQTLGFRGEALASISSVSRLTLTSRTEQQSEAWLAYAEGREMQVEVRPAAHPVGTTLEVAELFFNTPARRKFLRAEKTEFQHIEQLMRRVALTRFDVSFSLSHNGRMVHRWPACRDDDARLRRVATVCGRAFFDQALPLEQSYDQVKLHGWLLRPNARLQPPIQYCFINGRMIRDKLLMHAIRQGYADFSTDLAQLSYVIYLQLPAAELDVNVHPTKHEVRFSQARLIHDFLVQAVQQALAEQATLVVDEETGECAPPEPATAPAQRPAAYPPTRGDSPLGSYNYYVRERTPSQQQLNGYRQLVSTTAVASEASPPQPLSQSPSAREYSRRNSDHEASAGQLFMPSHYLLCHDSQQQSWCIDLQRELFAWWLDKIAAGESPVSQPLLLPIALDIDKAERNNWLQLQERALSLGVEFASPRPDKLVIHKLPAFLRRLPLAENIDAFKQALSAKEIADSLQLLLQLAAGRIDWRQTLHEVMARRTRLQACDWCQPVPGNLFQPLFEQEKMI